MKKNNDERSYLEDRDLCLWSLMDRTTYAIARTRDIELAHHKLLRVQATVLYILMYENRGVTIQEIANYDLKNHNAVLNLVSRMEKRGLVTKKFENDKSYVYITEKGRQLYGNAPTLSLKMAFSVLTDEEKSILESMLERLKSQARSMLGVDFVHPFIKDNKKASE